jgi:CPA2 family monovalent cation:H+ antiporter-2
MANLLGWSKTEGVFLGAALSISSSAILMTMLRESGELLQTRGQLIVGILVIEDIAAVILLTVLTGVATSGETDPGSIVVLAVKLATFGAVALVVGALVAPRVVGFVNGFQSQEALLIT